MKTLTLSIGGIPYDIKLQESIAQKVSQRIADDFLVEDSISVKKLLESYIRSVIEGLTLQEGMNEVIHNCEDFTKKC